MIYEIRIYEHVDGRADAVRRRFTEEVAPRFPKHDIELLGAFTDLDTGMLTYMTRFPDEESRKRAWASFGADPEWKAIKAASEVDGPLIAKQHVSVVAPAMTGLPIT
ncbi:NIPSNAP family containing protein [Agaricicola taiwanensis]|uniref:NIPSNAP family containing protein n=1 Tax=Agaricicola taiwanensis TaxID=591372 RepID=A0A8J2VIG9_9RHOB|nr:NIPSNAP family protein [Agaricicola taiwanensis]GGE30748.1 NIPSNAP family containing protein [Agaricicola taiwanensis]